MFNHVNYDERFADLWSHFRKNGCLSWEAWNHAFDVLNRTSMATLQDTIDKIERKDDIRKSINEVNNRIELRKIYPWI